MQPSNFVWLDEPTNHLDMRAKEVLLEALKGYEGTVVFVSHDRYFIDELAKKVFEVGDGQVVVHHGGYEDYLRRTKPEPEPVAAGEKAATPVEVKQTGQKRINPMKLKQLEDHLAEVESEIALRETDVAENEAQRSNYSSAQEIQRHATQPAAGRAAIETAILK